MGVLRRLSWLRLAALAALLGVGSIANATPVTFGQFQQNPAANEFTWTDNGSSADFATTGAGGATAVNFLYSNIVGLPGALTGQQAAHLYLSAHTSDAGTLFAGTVIQPISGTGTRTLQILRDTPYLGQSNLLTVTFTGTLVGGNNANSVSESSSSGGGDTVSFTSDFLDFSSTISRDMALSFTSLLPGLTIAGSFVDSFTTAGTGTFSSDPPPTTTSTPEPSSLFLSLIGLSGFFGVRYFRRCR